MTLYLNVLANIRKPLKELVRNLGFLKVNLVFYGEDFVEPGCCIAVIHIQLYKYTDT